MTKHLAKPVFFSTVASEKFEQGAGTSMEESADFHALVVIILLMFALLIMLLGGLSAWRKRQIEFGEFVGFAIRGFVLMCVVSVFLGIG
ncbi:hypothetical protein WE348_22990 (plasmid) [Alteromonas macleodii]|uniref:hypothetical protein n=1 Tax=Alteromonas macleodii TaxID=28108 RepID=UPI0030D3FFE8